MSTRIPTWATASKALQTHYQRARARLCSWHACASVWIATSFRPRPRMHDMTCSSPNTTTDSTTGWPLLSGRTNAAASQRPYQRSAARLPHGQHTQGCGKFHARCTARSARLSHAHGGPLGYRTSPLGVLASWITSLGARGSPPSERVDHLPCSVRITMTTLEARGSPSSSLGVRGRPLSEREDHLPRSSWMEHVEDLPRSAWKTSLGERGWSAWITSLGARGSPPSERVEGVEDLPRSAWIASL